MGVGEAILLKHFTVLFSLFSDHTYLCFVVQVAMSKSSK